MHYQCLHNDDEIKKNNNNNNINESSLWNIVYQQLVYLNENKACAVT